jgi:hypothetical protein
MRLVRFVRTKSASSNEVGAASILTTAEKRTKREERETILVILTVEQ